MSLHRERGAMALDDLRALPKTPLVIAEGTPLLASGALHAARAVRLVPMRKFQRAQLADAGGAVVRPFVCACGDPACEVDLGLHVGEVASRTVLAPGHGSSGYPVN
jgi:hypothetical protein